VAAGDVDLVQVHRVKKNPDAAILVNMAIRDEHIAIPFRQMDAMPAVADQHAA